MQGEDWSGLRLCTNFNGLPPTDVSQEEVEESVAVSLLESYYAYNGCGCLPDKENPAYV